MLNNTISINPSDLPIFYIERTMRNGRKGRLEMRPRGVAGDYEKEAGVERFVEIPQDVFLNFEMTGDMELPYGYARKKNATVNIDIAHLKRLCFIERTEDIIDDDLAILYDLLKHPTTLILDRELSLTINEGDDDEKTFLLKNKNIYNTWVYLEGIFTDSEPEDSRENMILKGVYTQKVQLEKDIDIGEEPVIMSIELSNVVNYILEELTFDDIPIYDEHKILLSQTNDYDAHEKNTAVDWIRDIFIDNYNNETFVDLEKIDVGWLDEPVESFLDYSSDDYDEDKEYYWSSIKNVYLYSKEKWFETFFKVIYQYWIKYCMHNDVNTFDYDEIMLFPGLDFETDRRYSKEYIKDLYRPNKHPYYYHNFYSQSTKNYNVEVSSSLDTKNIAFQSIGDSLIWQGGKPTKSSNFREVFSRPNDKELYFILLGGFMQGSVSGLFGYGAEDGLKKEYNNLLDFWSDLVESSGIVGSFNFFNSYELDRYYGGFYFQNQSIQDNKGYFKGSDLQKGSMYPMIIDFEKIWDLSVTESYKVLRGCKSSQPGMSEDASEEGENPEKTNKINYLEEEFDIKDIIFWSSPTARCQLMPYTYYGSGHYYKYYLVDNSTFYARKLYYQDSNYGNVIARVADQPTLNQNERNLIETFHIENQDFRTTGDYRFPRISDTLKIDQIDVYDFETNNYYPNVGDVYVQTISDEPHYWICRSVDESSNNIVMQRLYHDNSSVSVDNSIMRKVSGRDSSPDYWNPISNANTRQKELKIINISLHETLESGSGIYSGYIKCIPVIDTSHPCQLAHINNTGTLDFVNVDGLIDDCQYFQFPNREYGTRRPLSVTGEVYVKPHGIRNEFEGFQIRENDILYTQPNGKGVRYRVKKINEVSGLPISFREKLTLEQMDFDEHPEILNVIDLFHEKSTEANNAIFMERGDRKWNYIPECDITRGLKKDQKKKEFEKYQNKVTENLHVHQNNYGYGHTLNDYVMDKFSRFDQMEMTFRINKNSYSRYSDAMFNPNILGDYINFTNIPYSIKNTYPQLNNPFFMRCIGYEYDSEKQEAFIKVFVFGENVTK